jgi:hypothetical protein
VEVMFKMAPIFAQTYDFEGLFNHLYVRDRSDKVSKSNMLLQVMFKMPQIFAKSYDYERLGVKIHFVHNLQFV